MQARQLDPQLAMAYWGEAMANKQALWQYENVTAAQAVLAQMVKYKVVVQTGESCIIGPTAYEVCLASRSHTW